MVYCQSCGEVILGGGSVCKCGGRGGQSSAVGLNTDAKGAHEHVSSALTSGYTGLEEGLSRMLGDDDRKSAPSRNIAAAAHGASGGAGQPTNCDRCGVQITGAAIQAYGETFHATCFTCVQCGTQLSGGFIDRGGRPMCRACAAGGDGASAAATASTAAAPASKPAATSKPAAGKPAAKGAAASAAAVGGARAGGARNCAKCQQPIGAQGLLFENNSYHAECFGCTACGEAFNGGAYVVHEGQPYHEGCATELLAEKCTVCNQTLSGQYVGFGGQKFHKECFTCSKCAKAIAGQFALDKVKKTPICASCSAKK